MLSLKILYIFYFSVALVLTLKTYPSEQEFLTYATGRLFGVLTISALALQPFLTSRAKFLEMGVGLDRISRWHAFNGKLIFLFALAHPSLLFWTQISRLDFKFLQTFTLYHLLGMATLLGILVIVITAIYSAKLKLKYETWILIHKITYVVIFLGFAHSFFIGAGILNVKPLTYWWLFLLGVAFFSIIYRNLIHLFDLHNNWYEIIDIRNETSSVRSVFLKSINSKRGIIQQKPGQFAFITFLSTKLAREEHPFTISSAPNIEFISHSIKQSGDFTSQLGKLKVGDKAILDGPFGVFSNVDMKGPFIFIAGGIGITPFVSMLRYMDQNKINERVTLLYANRTFADIAFFEMLKNLSAKNKWLRVVHVLSVENNPLYYFGTLNIDVLKKEIDFPEISTIFLCGPPPMMRTLKKTLLILGAKKENILTEEFSLK